MIAALSLAMTVMFPLNGIICLFSFIVFEICVGIFWPTIGYLRGIYLPEETRATTMNFFRIPMNMLVILILSQNISMDLIFKTCVIFLIIAAFSQNIFYKLVKLTTKIDSIKQNELKNCTENPLIENEII